MEKLSELKKYESDMIGWRRDFHMHPEIGFEEFRTSEIISKLLKEFGLEVIEKFSKTSVIGILKNGSSKKVIALRADIDALGMDDLKDVEYKSTHEGKCHSCGHDAHTAVLLGVAKYFSENRDKVDGTIKFVFQAAEEGPDPGGAKLIMESGKLDDVDIMIGSHVDQAYKAGVIALKDGPLYASGGFFEVKIFGVGAHGAYPHMSKDSIITTMQIIEAFQHIITREIDPLMSSVISVCNIHAGDALNVIPQCLTFGGTIRTFDTEVSNYIQNRMKVIIESISKLNGCTSEIKINIMFPPLINDSEVNDIIREAAVKALGTESVVEHKMPEMGSEDFSFYAEKIKSSFFLWGVGNDTNCLYYAHHPKFDVDESSLVTAMAVFVGSVESYLK